MEGLQEILDKFKKDVIKQSRSNLTRLKNNSSKSLYKAIDGEVKVSKNSISIFFKMNPYGIFQDKGVSGTERKYNTPFSYKTKMPPAQSFETKIKNKGIQGRDKKGRFITQKSLSFAIARSIFKKGIKPSLFFTKPFEKAYKRLPDEAIKKYGLDVEKLINTSLKEITNGK